MLLDISYQMPIYLAFIMAFGVIMEQYIPYSLICDLSSRNLETINNNFIFIIKVTGEKPYDKSPP